MKPTAKKTKYEICIAGGKIEAGGEFLDCLASGIKSSQTAESHCNASCPKYRIKFVKDFPAAAKMFAFRQKSKFESHEAETN